MWLQVSTHSLIFAVGLRYSPSVIQVHPHSLVLWVHPPCTGEKGGIHKLFVMSAPISLLLLAWPGPCSDFPNLQAMGDIQQEVWQIHLCKSAISWYSPGVPPHFKPKHSPIRTGLTRFIQIASIVSLLA